MPEVSVVIPTYNRADVLPRAIGSVLNQSLENLELIVVDDASSDPTAEVVESFSDERLTYLRHDSNRNGSAARNTGIQAAEGRYIAFLDSDDEWHPSKIAAQRNELQNRSNEWIGCYCGVETTRDSRTKRFLADHFSHDARYEGQDEIIKGLLTLTGFVHGGSTLLAKRQVVDAIGGFDEDFERHQDVEFTIRLAKAGKIARVDAPLVTLHESGRPSPDQVARSKAKLFERFDDDIQRLESQGEHIRDVHRFELARSYIRTGQLRKGVSQLFGSRPSNGRQVLGFGLDAVLGLRNSILQTP